MPRSIHEEWTAFCRARQIEPGTVFRSLIHHFLLAPARPSNTGSRWLRNGVIVPIPWPRKKALRARTRITRGAQVAFDTHADEWNVPPMALARGILGDFLEGKIPRVKMVAFSELWGDADRYLHPEKFR